MTPNATGELRQVTFRGPDSAAAGLRQSIVGRRQLETPTCPFQSAVLLNLVLPSHPFNPLDAVINDDTPVLLS